LEFPARYFVQFLHNHGMLSATVQPQWRVVVGGSQQYMRALTRPFANRIRLRSPIETITRHADDVEVRPRSGPAQRFDRVIIAAHSDQALRMLTDPSPAEQEI